VKTPEI